MRVVNVIGDVMPRPHRAIPGRLRKGVMGHRFGVDDRWGHVLGHTPQEIAPSFLGDRPEHIAVAKQVGFRFPYQFAVGGDRGHEDLDGVVWQCLPLDVIAPHARDASDDYVSVGWIGDFRYFPPSQKQFRAAAELVAALTSALGLDPYKTVKGHGEVSECHDGTKAPGKSNACPGDFWQMNVFRDEVSELMRQRAYDPLLEMGIVIDAP